MSTSVGTIDLSLILNSDKFNSQLKNTDAQASKTSSKISSTLSKIGKAVAVAFSVTAIVKFGKECLNVATETSNAWIGLNSILTSQGKSFSQAKSFINDYISDGLVPLNNAVTAYKNLAARGYSSDQIEKTMTALKNSATFGRQSTYSLGEAVQTASEGLKNENSILVDNAGVTKNVAKMWEDYAKSIGKTTNNLTTEEKIQAEVNGILEETKFQSNDAAIYTNTYSGRVAQLSQAFTTMKTAIGNVIQPIAKLFIPVITSAVNAVTKLFTALSGLLSLFGLKADSVETVSSGMDDLASSADSASDAVSSVSDSADDASDSAKKASNNLATFDDLNVLSQDTDSSSGSSSGGSSGGSSSGLTDSLDVSSTTESVSELSDFMSKLIDPFVNAWNSKGQAVVDAMNNAFNGIKSLITAIGDSFAKIWTNGTVQTTLELTLQILANILNTIGNCATAWANAWIEGGKGDSIIQSLANTINNILAIIEGVTFAISEWWKTDKAQQFCNSVLGIYEILSGWIEKITEALKKVWENGGQHAFTSLMDAGSNLTTIFEIILDAVDPVVTALIDLSENALSKLLDAVGWAVDKLNEFGDWLINNEGVIKGVAATVLTFMAAWKVTEIMSFIAQSGGLVAAFTKITAAIWTCTGAKIADKLETVALTLMYAKDFVVSIASGTAALIKQAAQWVINTAMKVADTAATIASTAATTAATVATWLFNAALAVLTSPITLVVLAIGALIAIIVALVKNWDTVSAALSAGWEWIKEKATEIFGAIGQFLSQLWEGIKNVAITVWNAIKSFFINYFNTVKTIFTTVWNAISTIISTVINTIKNTITTVFNAIKTVISNIFNGIKTTVTNIWNGIKNGIINAVNSIKNGIVNAFQTAYNKIKSIFSGIASFFTGIWDKVKNTFSALGTKIGDAISGAVKSGINGVLGMIENIVNKFVGMINGAISVINAIPGVNISKLSELSIPRLAEGGYVKANTPQLAMIGDNKHQGEVVAPEDKMLDMILTALKMFQEQNNNNNDNGGSREIIINFAGSLAQLVRLLKPELDKESLRRGDKLILGGET